MYSYADNSPINLVDTEGTSSSGGVLGRFLQRISQVFSDGCSAGYSESGGYYVDLSVAVQSSLWYSPLVNGLYSSQFVSTPASYASDRANNQSTDATRPTESTAIIPYYPPNNGFADTPTKAILPIGTALQRTGNFSGRFVAPAGTPFYQLSLPYNQLGEKTVYLEVVQPVNVLKGPVAPWFGQPGGGTQFILLDGPVIQLVNDGFLEIKK